jgi:hypothetical protein
MRCTVVDDHDCYHVVASGDMIPAGTPLIIPNDEIQTPLYGSVWEDGFATVFSKNPHAGRGMQALKVFGVCEYLATIAIPGNFIHGHVGDYMPDDKWNIALPDVGITITPTDEIEACYVLFKANHSPELANAGMFIEGDVIYIKALRAIGVGDEVFFDYGKSYGDEQDMVQDINAVEYGAVMCTAGMHVKGAGGRDVTGPPRAAMHVGRIPAYRIDAC